MSTERNRKEAGKCPFKKNDVFTFTYTIGVDVTAVILTTIEQRLSGDIIGSRRVVCYGDDHCLYICKLTYRRKYFAGCVPAGEENPVVLDKVLDISLFQSNVEIPECDEIIREYKERQQLEL